MLIKRERIITLSITITLILAVICIGLKESYPDLSDELRFSFGTDGIEEKISCWKNSDGEYEVFLPGYVDIAQLKVCLNTRDSVIIDGTEFVVGSYCKRFVLNVPYDITLACGHTVVNSRIIFRQSENIASVHIDTESRSMEYIHSSKDNKEKGTIRIYDPQGLVHYVGDLEHITGRGNSTWLASEKKAYGIKLTQEIDLLEMGAAQKWVLLANAFDETNMKNKVVYDFASAVGLQFSPKSQWIDLYLNNEYAGLYLLCEKIEVHPNRVNIAYDGSSLVSMEYQSRLISQNLPFVLTDAEQALRIHYPENPSEQDLEIAEELWQSVENAIISEDGIDSVTGKAWYELIDVKSWARKYLIEEIFGNLDAAFISQYFYIDGDASDIKVYAGPVWDFDSSFKSVWQTSSPNVWCANRLIVEDGYEAPWFYLLCKKPEFMEYVITLYKEEFLPLLYELNDEKFHIYAEHIHMSAQMNAIRWNVRNDMHELVGELQTYLSERIEFLSDVWLEGTEHVIVKALPEYGGHYAYFALKKGDTLASLPDMYDITTFAGWYYSDTHEPINTETPVLYDLEIYSKWDSVSIRAESRIKQLIPLGIIAIMGLCILGIDIGRYKVKKGEK